jgi:hypothetical protein
METCNKCNICNYVKCNCVVSTPPVVDCPTPNKCGDKEMFTSDCFDFTSAAIKCGNKSVIYANNSLTQAISNVVEFLCDKKCKLDVTIGNTNPFELTANVANGVAPYTYLWSFPSNAFTGHNTGGIVNNQTVTFSPTVDSFLNGTQTYNMNRTIFMVTVTDANGCTQEAYYRYVSKSPIT